MGRKWVIMLAALGLGLFSLTAGIWLSIASSTAPPVQARTPQIPEVTVADLQRGDLQPVVFIDVRQGWERALDRIEPSAHIPMSQIESGEAIALIRELIDDADRFAPTVVLYCARGVRSARAQHQLAAQGIETVSLQGGITAWRQTLSPTQEQTLTQQIAIPLSSPG